MQRGLRHSVTCAEGTAKEDADRDLGGIGALTRGAKEGFLVAVTPRPSGGTGWEGGPRSRCKNCWEVQGPRVGKGGTRRPQRGRGLTGDAGRRSCAAKGDSDPSEAQESDAARTDSRRGGAGCSAQRGLEERSAELGEGGQEAAPANARPCEPEAGEKGPRDGPPRRQSAGFGCA